MTRFLIDAQFPMRLARALREAGFDALHTLDLPRRNATLDADLNALSVGEKRVLVTKDADFVNSFMVSKRPYKLLLVSTGNIDNRTLEALFAKNLAYLAELFEEHDYVELGRDVLILHQ